MQKKDYICLCYLIESYDEAVKDISGIKYSKTL